MEQHIVWYVMKECGCRVTSDGLGYQQLTTSGGYSSRVRVCGTHGTRIDHREAECCSCGEIFSRGFGGKMPKRCQPCREEHHRAQVRKNQLLLDNLDIVEANHDCPMFRHVCKVCIEPALPCAVSQSQQSTMAAA